MKKITLCLLTLITFFIFQNCYGSIAICEVIKKNGNKITVECTEIRGEFEKGSKVKIVSDNN